MHIAPVKKGRLFRMLVGIFLPVLLQVTMIFIYDSMLSQIMEFYGLNDLVQKFSYTVFYGYLLTGLQSIVYAVVMEFVINPRIANHVFVVLCSGLLGLLSGFSLVLILGEFGHHELWYVFSTLSGLVTGLILRLHYYKASKGVASED